VYKIANERYIPEEVIWKDKKIETLADNQIILPISIIPVDKEILQIGSIPMVDIRIRAEELLDNYVNNYFNKIENNPFNSPSEYKQYIVGLFADEDNIYHPGKTYAYFKETALGEFFIKHIDAFDNLLLSNEIVKFENIEVVGFYYDTYYRGKKDKPIIISNELYKQLLTILPSDISKLIVGRLDDMKYNKNLVKYITNIENYEIENEIVYSLKFSKGFLFTTVKKLSFYLSLFFIILAIFYICNFLTMNIKIYKKEIGILRSIGTSRRDIIKIFSFQNIFLSGINFIFSSILFVLFYNLFYITLRRNYDIQIKILSFKMWIIIMLFLISFIVGIISLILPIIKINKQQPINIINNI